MEKVLLIISVALIIIVLLQSGKANDAGQIISGGNTVLLGKSKEGLKSLLRGLLMHWVLHLL